MTQSVRREKKSFRGHIVPSVEPYVSHVRRAVSLLRQFSQAGKIAESMIFNQDQLPVDRSAHGNRREAAALVSLAGLASGCTAAIGHGDYSAGRVVWVEIHRPPRQLREGGWGSATGMGNSRKGRAAWLAVLRWSRVIDWGTRLLPNFEGRTSRGEF